MCLNMSIVADIGTILLILWSIFNKVIHFYIQMAYMLEY